MDSGNPSDNEERTTARGHGIKRGPSFGTVVLGLALIGGLFWLTFYIYTAEKVARGIGQILDLGNKTVDAIAKTVVGISENMRLSGDRDDFCPMASIGDERQSGKYPGSGHCHRYGNLHGVFPSSGIPHWCPSAPRFLRSCSGDLPVSHRSQWQLADQGAGSGTLVVVAPPLLLPSLPVAFDTSGLKKKENAVRLGALECRRKSHAVGSQPVAPAGGPGGRQAHVA